MKQKKCWNKEFKWTEKAISISCIKSGTVGISDGLRGRWPGKDTKTDMEGGTSCSTGFDR